MAIYIKLDKKPNSLRQLMREYFSYAVREPYVTNVRTYYNKECTILQCSAGKWRSFEDVLECAKTYFPSITPKKLLSLLLTLNIKNIDNERCELYMRSCADIRRINVFYSPYVMGYSRIIEEAKYNSKYSWKELLDKLNIKNYEDLENYRRVKK